MMSNVLQDISADIDNNVKAGKAFLLDDPEECSKLLELTPNNLSIVVQNIRSINKNFDDFSVYLTRLKTKIDVIIFTECWLPHLDTLPTIPNYTGYASSNHINQNSGVVAYVHSSLDVSVHEPPVSDGDGLVIKISNKYAIFAIYRTPSIYSIDNFLDSLDLALSHLKSFTDIVLVGDANIDITEGKIDKRARTYLNCLSMHGLLPSHIFPTHDSTCIDHSFLKPNHDSTTIVCASSVTDHSPVTLSLQQQISKTKKIKTFKKVDYEKAVDDLSNIDWSEILNCNDPDLITYTFLTIVSNTLDKYTTTHKIPNRQFNIKPWITPGLLRCMKWRDKLHQKHKKRPENLILLITYKRYRNHCNKLLNKLKNKYQRLEINKHRNDTKRTWKLIKEMCYLNSNEKPALELLKVRGSPLESVNYVNDFFVNVGRTLAREVLTKSGKQEEDLASQLRSDKNPLNSIVLLPTSSDEIQNIIIKLKSTPSAGWDGISSKFMKLGARVLSTPISHLCNVCFSSGVFPQLLKRSVVIPVFKSGDRDSVTCYRPISLLPTLAKVVERALNARLVGYLDSTDFFSSNQYGFREGISTTDAVDDLVIHTAKKLDMRNRCLGIFLDLAKAFDTVSIPILIQRLENAGVRGVALDLFKSYLSDRSQTVKIDTVESRSLSVDYGVPQGSVLGPILFLIYVNNLCDTKLQNARIIAFADDTVLLFDGPTWADVKRSAEEGFKAVLDWLSGNILTLNLEKTKYITFSINITTQPQDFTLQAHSCDMLSPCFCPSLSSVNFIKYLGVIVDQHLNWTRQIEVLCNKTRRLICIFKRIRALRDVDIVRSVYFSLCQSILSYAIAAWGGAKKTQMLKLERAQRALIKVINFKGFRFSTETLYKEYCVLTVRQLYIYATILRQHNVIPPPTISRRHKFTIYHTIKSKSAFARKFSYIRGPYLYNKLNNKCGDLRLCSRFKVKKVLKDFLLQLNYDSTEDLLKIET